MYLSNELISKRVKSAKRLLIVGGIFTAMSVYGIVAGLAGNAKLRSGLATYLVMLVMFGAVFSNQVRAGFSGVCSYCNSPLSGK